MMPGPARQYPEGQDHAGSTIDRRHPPRIAYLESIRGLAALQVLLLHFLAAFAPDLVFALPAGAAIAGYIHLSPLYFLYDGYSAVYIFFVLSGYVLTRSFERQLAQPLSIVVSRVIRLGLPAIAAVLVAVAVMVIFARPNAQVGVLTGSDWFTREWNPDLSLISVLRDSFANALFLGYSGLSGVAFLTPWQQPVEQSFVSPLWTLSIEFYGSMVVLGLCLAARRSRVLWWSIVLLCAIFTIRSAYVCFIVGHVAAAFHRAEKPAPDSALLPVFSIIFGIFLCVLAEAWQPDWLRSLCAYPTYFLFPGQFAPMQQKTYGAILVLTGIVNLQSARAFLSSPWIVSWSRLSFPIYLIHWPILFGPAAALFLVINNVAGLEAARIIAIAAGLILALIASRLFLPIDRFALEASRRLRKRMSDMPAEASQRVAAGSAVRAMAVR
jgi:peptidoglycan/LPS O-acetylase OafA/YrhL